MEHDFTLFKVKSAEHPVQLFHAVRLFIFNIFVFLVQLFDTVQLIMI